jgi:hypothetical protein
MSCHRQDAAAGSTRVTCAHMREVTDHESTADIAIPSNRLRDPDRRGRGAHRAPGGAYGRDHSNPPVRIEPRWDRARTRELAVRACFDCHSNQTRWPWYSHVAPISWLVQHDVEEGARR